MWVVVSVSWSQADYYIRRSETTKTSLRDVLKKRQTDSWLWRGQCLAVFLRPPKRRWRSSNRTSSFVHQKDIIRNLSPSRILGEEMKELKDLADKSLATRILDHEAYGPKIQQIFQRVKEATMSFFVRTIMFIQGYVYSNQSFPVRNGDQHPANGK